MNSVRNNYNQNFILCEGKTKKVFTIDIDSRKNPTLVGDVRTIHKKIPNNSIKLLIFKYCPFFVYESKSVAEWFKKVKPGGKILFYGPKIETFKETLNSLIKESKQPFSTKATPTYILLKKLIL